MGGDDKVGGAGVARSKMNRRYRQYLAISAISGHTFYCTAIVMSRYWSLGTTIVKQKVAMCSKYIFVDRLGDTV